MLGIRRGDIGLSKLTQVGSRLVLTIRLWEKDSVVSAILRPQDRGSEPIATRKKNECEGPSSSPRFPSSPRSTAPIDPTVLRAERNLVAVHCRQTGGVQLIDMHIIDSKRVPKLPRTKMSTTPFRSQIVTRWGAEVVVTEFSSFVSASN